MVSISGTCVSRVYGKILPLSSKFLTAHSMKAGLLFAVVYISAAGEVVFICTPG